MAVVDPMELLVGALEESVLGGERPLVLRHESDVRGGGLAQPGQLHQSIKQAGAHLALVRSRRCKQAAAGGGREGGRHLQLGVILAAGALVGFGPAAVRRSRPRGVAASIQFWLLLKVISQETTKKRAI